jgi:hypothetical protein
VVPVPKDAGKTHPLLSPYPDAVNLFSSVNHIQHVRSRAH